MERHHPKLNPVAKANGLPERRVTISLAEIGIWVTAFAVAWSAPHWIGETSVLISFYGIIALMSWRLRQFVPFGVALILAVVLGLIATWATVFILNP